MSSKVSPQRLFLRYFLLSRFPSRNIFVPTTVHLLIIKHPGGSASGTVGTAAGWFDPYSISNLGGGYHPAMQHGTLAETVELALGRGRVGGGGGGAATSSRGRSGSVYDIGVNPRLQGEGGTVGGIGMEGYMDIRSARQVSVRKREKSVLMFLVRESAIDSGREGRTCSSRIFGGWH